MKRCDILAKYCKPVIGVLLSILLAIAVLWLIRRYEPFRTPVEVVDDLGGNIFPSAILPVATTDTIVIIPSATLYVGNPKSLIGIRVKSRRKNSRIRVVVEETGFFAKSVSEFILKEPWNEYVVFPDIIWKYEALVSNEQPSPFNFSVKVEMNDRDLGQGLRILSMRSIHECLLGYVTPGGEFHDTSVLFAAYVNEDNPAIDRILREALNTRLVNRFMGYQNNNEDAIQRQVYALWYVLQQRNFRYSSISNTSLSSNVVYSQRVRTFGTALESSQINCVDGSLLFASLLRAVNIDPVLVRIPGHMFVGYYTDIKHTRLRFIETTMIGDVDLQELFPGQQLDSSLAGKSDNELSRITFQKSEEYATRLYEENKAEIHSGRVNYMFLEISREVRGNIQPIAK